MLLIGNGNLITRQKEKAFIKNGAVAIEGATIKEVGTTADLQQKYPDAEFIDAKGGVIMPGFINMHNHIYSSFARGLSINGYHPKNFMDILAGQWFKLDSKMDNQTTYHSGRVAYLDSIKNGVTTMFDHQASYGEITGSLDRLSQAADEFGVRTCLCYEVSDRHGEKQAQQAIDENSRFIKEVAKRTDDMQYAMMGMHAAFTLSDETITKAREVTPENVGFHIHVAEDLADVQDSLHKYNKPIINRLFDLGILGSKTMLGHCIYINPHEMKLIKDTDTMVVTNPESNMGNAVGCPPVLRMFNEFAILCGLGTDGYTNDITESYKVGNIIHKHHLADPNAGWSEIPMMLFENNATMANRYFKTKLGVLEAGAAADVIVLDYYAPTPMTENNFNSHILFGMNGKDVRDTIINGDVKMRNREVVGVDQGEVYAHAREEAQKLWDRING